MAMGGWIGCRSWKFRVNFQAIVLTCFLFHSIRWHCSKRCLASSIPGLLFLFTYGNPLAFSFKRPRGRCKLLIAIQTLGKLQEVVTFVVKLWQMKTRLGFSSTVATFAYKKLFTLSLVYLICLMTKDARIITDNSLIFIFESRYIGR